MNRPIKTCRKKNYRKILKEKRNALDPDTCRSSDTAIFKAITSWDVYQKAETVFCFVGTEDEINTRPVLGRSSKKRKTGGCTEMYQQRHYGSI